MKREENPWGRLEGKGPPGNPPPHPQLLSPGDPGTPSGGGAGGHVTRLLWHPR